MNKTAQKPRTPKPNAITNDQQIQQLWEAIEDLVEDDSRIHAKLHALSVDSREHDERLQVVERVDSESDQNASLEMLNILSARVAELTHEVTEATRRNKWRQRFGTFVLCAFTGMLALDLGRLAGWW